MCQVKEIPETFLSIDHYMKSFITPLIEETHADLLSSITTVSRAPILEVLDVRESINFKPPNGLYYDILLSGAMEVKNIERKYKPVNGDLIALSDVIPRRIVDLNRPKISYLIGIIYGMQDEDSYRIHILSSKPISFQKPNNEKGEKGDKYFVVYLSNLTTNLRIWASLNPNVENANLNIIKTLLKSNPSSVSKHLFPLLFLNYIYEILFKLCMPIFTAWLVSYIEYVIVVVFMRLYFLYVSFLKRILFIRICKENFCKVMLDDTSLLRSVCATA